MKNSLREIAVLMVVGILFCVSLSALACEKISVKGMTCESCVKKIESTFRTFPEIEDVQVDLQGGTVALHYKKGKQLTSTQIKTAVESAGFSLGTTKNE